LIDLILGDLRLDRLKNGVALEQFQAEVVTISSIDITRNGHEVGQLQCLPIGIDRLQPRRPFHNPGHLSLPLRSTATWPYTPIVTPYFFRYLCAHRTAFRVEPSRATEQNSACRLAKAFNASPSMASLSSSSTVPMP
jgi:hypothetical protein